MNGYTISLFIIGALVTMVASYNIFGEAGIAFAVGLTTMIIAIAPEVEE